MSVIAPATIPTPRLNKRSQGGGWEQVKISVRAGTWIILTYFKVAAYFIRDHEFEQINLRKPCKFETRLTTTPCSIDECFLEFVLR